MQKVVLYGSGKENIEFKYMNDRGDTSVRRHPFEGVLHNMERRYKDGIQRGARRAGEVHQQSPVRQLRRYASAPRGAPRVCGKHPLPTISDMSIGHAMDFFNNLKLSGQRAKIAEKC